ncbi:exonuclease domain-containing protein [Natranaerobius trueperi]|uniref:Exonuclease n=1 Tax=Natranaerobius trueperi TaxID=759412 RepID=A0A226BWF1_9FIRM|nr:exonuclease domain-containing protein [Natranaerobius trueperi]OWZ83326.1 exonuclease [Natranaerobius trueperi]
MDFVAIDFETANSSRGSACALGIVVVERGEIKEKKHWLIRPKNMDFKPYNIYIHGIKPEDVKNKPEFNRLWDEVYPYLEEKLIIAHNASFDISVLRHVLDEYDIPYPNFDYMCTQKLAEKAWPNLQKYRLNYIADTLGVNFKHHDALEDSYACAKIALAICKERNINCLYHLIDVLKMSKGKLYSGGYKPARINEAG